MQYLGGAGGLIGIVIGKPRPRGICCRSSSSSCVIIGTLGSGTPSVGVISWQTGVIGWTICEFCVTFLLLFFFCLHAGRGVLYHFSLSYSGKIVITVSSGIFGIGVLLRVQRGWIFFAALTMRGAVVSLDVDGTATL